MFQILLADDNVFYRSFLRNILTRHFPSIRVAEASDARHALSLCDELHPQMIFLDIKLPDRNGLDLTRQFKSSNPGIVVYVATQYDIPEYRLAAKECGADQVIVKGESNEVAIVAMVKAVLASRLRRVVVGESEEVCSPGE